MSKPQYLVDTKQCGVLSISQHPRVEDARTPEEVRGLLRRNVSYEFVTIGENDPVKMSYPEIVDVNATP